MSKFIIQGGKKLSGTIDVAGNKNAVLPIMAATILVEGDTLLSNVPRIRDVDAMTDILLDLGASVERTGPDGLQINTDRVHSHIVSAERANRLRASVLLLGPLFARFGKVTLHHPGGDIIGKRSIDTHLKALEAIGAKTERERTHYDVKRSKTTIASETVLFLDEPSVTGTENAIMACVLGDRTIHIQNAACEPHIVDLVRFLVSCGASIDGVGTNHLVIRGAHTLKGSKHTIAPDYLESGTFAVLSVVTGGAIKINHVVAEDIPLPLHVLSEMGVKTSIHDGSLHVSASTIHAPEKRIQAAPHPGFPTDLMSPFIVLGTQATGETLFHDPLYESRMFFVDRLISMGAHITICDPHRVIVSGPSKLHGSYQASPDIRAGIALVIAALIAEGESVIDHAEIVERGYERIAERLAALGADITRID